MKFEGADNPLIELENKALERIRKCVDVLAAKPFRDEFNNGKAGHRLLKLIRVLMLTQRRLLRMSELSVRLPRWAMTTMKRWCHCERGS